MLNLIRRIPLIVWAIILSAISFLIVHFDIFGYLDNEQVKLLGGLFTLIGLIFVSIQVQAQWKNNKITTEYLNQPKFEIYGFGINEIQNGHPAVCSLKHDNINDCIDYHWFDIVQNGELPAINIKIGLIHKKEIEIINSLKNRWQEVKTLIKGDKFQFKLLPNAIPFNHFESKKNGIFYILLDYQSGYSKIRYKNIYELNYSPFAGKENDWKKRIRYFDISLEEYRDSNSITTKELLLNIWKSILLKTGIAKDFSIYDWKIKI